MSGDDGLKLDGEGELSVRRDIRPKDKTKGWISPGRNKKYTRGKITSDIKVK